jgi:HEXXH motif-containing protein
MLLDKQIESYLQNPFPLWNFVLLKDLIICKWQNLVENSYLQDSSKYSTANVFLKRSSLAPEFQEIKTGIFIEAPDLLNLSSFYQEHGLEPSSKIEQESINAVGQLRAALDFLSGEMDCGKSIERLVKCIQVLKQPEPEFDVSYSHPEIPFTIFVSIGDGKSQNDVIRLAESVLHESMHLKLTLIENFSPLVIDNTQHFFSPWREEERPVQGVLHGIYVFRAILDFYEAVLSRVQNHEQYDFIDWRIESIKSELGTLSSFPSNKGLSLNGAILARNLLPSS